MSDDTLPLIEFQGTAAECGAAYGAKLTDRILGFAKAELNPTKARLTYAEKCWKHVVRSAPHATDFLEGMSVGSGIPRNILTLVTLHEEIVHQPHCTAFAVTGTATRDGNTIIGQNWDWSPALYPWPGLLRLMRDDAPRTVTYHYPGLWACAGVNETGLGLVWTGGGYFPKVEPVVGVPTYVLIDEILLQPNVGAALDWLAGVKHAGCFIFFLGDATGATAIVEAVPGRTKIVRNADSLSRANHYLCKDIAKCGSQKRPNKKKTSTLQRADRMNELRQKYDGQFDGRAAEAILTDRGNDWPWVHQYPGGKSAHELAGMTIDSLYFDCRAKTLHTARGGRDPGPWIATPV